MRNQYKVLSEKYDQIKKEGTLMPGEDTIDKVVKEFNHAKHEFLKGIPLETVLDRARYHLEPDINIEEISDKKVNLGKGVSSNAYVGAYVSAPSDPENPWEEGPKIVINIKIFYAFLKGNMTEQRLRSLIGHEDIHRKQYDRLKASFANKTDQGYVRYMSGVFKDRERKSQQTYADYLNLRKELMSYAYELAYDLYKRTVKKGYNKQDALRYVFQSLQKDPLTIKQIEKYTRLLTPINKKRFYNYVYRYIEQLYDKPAKQPKTELDQMLNSIFGDE